MSGMVRSSAATLATTFALVFGLAHCAADTDGKVEQAVGEGSIRAHFQAHHGQYVVAELGGGGDVNANRAGAGPWETFAIEDVNGGELRGGDVVRIRTHDGTHYLSAFRGGGGSLNARSTSAWGGEFLLERVAGQGAIHSGDEVALRTLRDFYVVAEEGGGREVLANRTARGPWETFKITLPDEPPPPPPAQPTPPGPQPPPGQPSAGPRTPDPPAGKRLPLPNERAVVDAVAAEHPDWLLNSCQKTGGTWQFLDAVVDRLRQKDTRWGYNWKRGNVGDPSMDVVDYHFGAGPDEGSPEVYVVDVIGGHCPGPTDPPPRTAFGDVTAFPINYTTPGALWTGRGRF